MQEDVQFNDFVKMGARALNNYVTHGPDQSKQMVSDYVTYAASPPKTLGQFGPVAVGVGILGLTAVYNGLVGTALWRFGKSSWKEGNTFWGAVGYGGAAFHWLAVLAAITGGSIGIFGRSQQQTATQPLPEPTMPSEGKLYEV